MSLLVADGGPIDSAVWSADQGLVSIRPAAGRQAIEAKLAAPVKVRESIVRKSAESVEIGEAIVDLAPGSIEHARRVFEALGCDVLEIDG